MAKSSVMIQTPETFTLIDHTGLCVFALHVDGTCLADWARLRAMKDEFLLGKDEDLSLNVVIGAALWFARNT